MNNTNLQKIRDFVESQAKILLITSIPQDVFIASGATVKPSLLFFKKFTDDEVRNYEKIGARAEKEIKVKYKPDIDKANKKFDDAANNIELKRIAMNEAMALIKNKKLDVLEVKDKIQLTTSAFDKAGNELKEAKKNLFAEKKIIEEKIAVEIKAQIKKEFNYQIPIAEVEKAGISSTGSQIENELEPLAKEFKKYREENKLWTTYVKEINYHITDEEVGRVRIIDGVVSEQEVFYNK